jgi:predicted DNA-binding transcriptional regulator AlpA
MDTQQISPRSVDQLLRIKDVAALTTLSKSCINLWVAQNRFPQPTALSSTLKVWRSSDINSWLDAQFDPKGGA